jgi:alpha-ketoglutarate-dependent taurine dioxygenase
MSADFAQVEMQRLIDVKPDEDVVIMDHRLNPTPLQIRDTPLTGPMVWTRQTLRSTERIIEVGTQCVAEIEQVLATLRRNPLPMLLLQPAMFELSACQAMMDAARHEIQQGPGFVIIDRLPVDRFSVEEARSVYWLLMQMVGRPVAQSFDAKMIYDVKDQGRTFTTSVRGDTTTKNQNFHTDNNYNLCEPHHVSLFCLKTAQSGGINSIVSFYSAYNEMLARHPFELIERLYQPYLFNRQREHAPGDPLVLRHPLFSYDGETLLCKLSRIQIVNGHRMAGIPLDDLGLEALMALDAIMMEEQFNREFFFEPGQIQIVDNRRCGHRRTGFVDYDEPERKRHLLRIWLRNTGRPFYNG